jgi:hypothetical protein
MLSVASLGELNTGVPLIVSSGLAVKLIAVDAPPTVYFAEIAAFD